MVEAFETLATAPKRKARVAEDGDVLALVFSRDSEIGECFWSFNDVFVSNLIKILTAFVWLSGSQNSKHICKARLDEDYVFAGPVGGRFKSECPKEENARDNFVRYDSDFCCGEMLCCKVSRG